MTVNEYQRKNFIYLSHIEQKAESIGKIHS